MNIQRLYSLTRKALDEYNLIDDNDIIAIGVSGGKDSLALLYALAGLRRFYPKKFDIVAITVDLGFEGLNLEDIKKICEDLQVPYHIIKTNISQVVFDVKKEHNPCSLCAKMRKGALINKLKDLNINKLAYAHHQDDIIETLLLSMIYEGRIATISPQIYFEDNNITVIRPLIYIKEVDIKGFINKYNIKVQGKICPKDGNSKRQYIKELIRDINIDNPGVKDRLYTAIENSSLEGWIANGTNK